MLDHIGRRWDALPVDLGESRVEIEGISVDNGIDEQVQIGGLVELALDGLGAQFSKAVEEQCRGQGVLGFALIEAGGGVASHFRVLPPLGQKDRPVDTPQIAKRKRQSVLARECGQLHQQGRTPDLTGTNGGDEAQDIVPVCLDPLDVDRLADEWREILLRRVTGEEI